MQSVLSNLFLVVLLSVSSSCFAQAHNETANAAEPTLLHAVAPEVSGATRGLRQTGELAIKVWIDSQGKVTLAAPLFGPNFALRDALSAVKQWIFSASEQVTSLRIVTLHFYFKIASPNAPPSVLGMESLSPNFFQIRYPAVPRPAEITPQNYPHKGELIDQRCKIHGAQMQKDLVPIVYGLMGYKPGYERAHEKHFPNDNTWIGGGCVVENTVIEHDDWQEEIKAPRYGEVTYCTICRRAATRWSQTHSWQESKKTR